MLASLVLAVLWTVSAAAQQPAASSRLDDILKRGTLRVGMTGDYLPFTYFDKTTGKFRGFDVAMGGISITLDRQKKGMFSTPIMREGKTPIARCADKGKYETIADIDRAGTRVIVNPGGTNERFAKANIKSAEIKTWNDNVTIFDEIAKGNADLMMTDSSETRYQQKQHAGVLCAVHPDKPFDFAEKAYWLQRDAALKAFVDQWLHIATEDGSYRKIYAAWFD